MRKKIKHTTASKQNRHVRERPTTSDSLREGGERGSLFLCALLSIAGELRKGTGTAVATFVQVFSGSVSVVRSSTRLTTNKFDYHGRLPITAAPGEVDYRLP